MSKSAVKSVSFIGIDPAELPWLRMLVFLLRHPDPLVSEMAQHSVLYLTRNASRQSGRGDEPLDHAG